jgi:hypothetical protein
MSVGAVEAAEPIEESSRRSPLPAVARSKVCSAARLAACSGCLGLAVLFGCLARLAVLFER